MRVKSKIAITVAALVGATGAVAVASPALADIPRPKIIGSSVCDPASATHTMTTTITNATETPLAVTQVSASPGAPVSSISGIAVGDVLPPASQGSLVVTMTVHSYQANQAAVMSFRLEGSTVTYSGGLLLPLCGEPVQPTVAFASHCDEFEITVAMPAGGYAAPMHIDYANQPTLVVEPGGAAKTWRFAWNKVNVPVDVWIAGVGPVATGRWTKPSSCEPPPPPPPASLGVFNLFSLANFRYVITAASGPNNQGLVDSVRAIEIAPEAKEADFEFFDAGGGDVAIKQRANSSRLTVVNETTALRWTWTDAITDAQRFQVIGNSDGTVSLRSRVNGKYVTAEKAGAQPLFANRAAIGPWEKFNRYADNTGPGPIHAGVNSMFVTAEKAGAQPLIANRGVVGQWEYFTVEDLGNGNVALKSLVNGKYVTAEKAGAQPLIANRAVVGPWETFKLITNADGTQSLQAQINGKYVTAESAGKKALIANRTAIGPWEKFAIYG
ncbi:hypothetical protein AB0J74_32515 [Asanoa sp. NPDC049573]|uniref:hypothetical protein n=1 Tax=Asanoa sp. NPDC049573 TaxID=3155396 RepID=UPI003433DFAC